MFVEMGADSFASRGHTELEATGKKSRKRSVECRQTLTQQEVQIA
jgi:hypothetical protein